MKVRFYRWYSGLLTTLLGLLGFESCDAVDEYGAPEPAEYGAPYVGYVVKGHVADEAGNPIPGIKVMVKPYFDDRYYDARDSTITDAEGNYATSKLHDTAVGWNEHLIFEDIDGEANGGDFQGDTLSIDALPKVQTVGRQGTWDLGEYEVTGNVTLKKK